MTYILSSASPAVAAIICSAVLFLRIKKDNILGAKSFFAHYIFAFAIIAVASIQVVLMNLGAELYYGALLALYVLTILTVFISYLLFYRGTTLLFTKNKFFPTILPFLVLPAGLIFSIAILFYLNFSTIIIYTAIVWGFLLVNDNLLGSIFSYSFATGVPIKSLKRKLGALVLALGWYLILALDFILWASAVLYDPTFWIFKIVSMKWWFIARAVVYFVILCGVLLSAKYLQYPNGIEEENEAAQAE